MRLVISCQSASFSRLPARWAKTVNSSSMQALKASHTSLVAFFMIFKGAGIFSNDAGQIIH